MRLSKAQRLSRRLGIQGKLIVCFMVLLVGGLGTSYYFFLREARTALKQDSAERAGSLAYTLAMASRVPLDNLDKAELNRMVRELVKSDDIVNVAFADDSGRVLVSYCVDPDFQWKDVMPTGASIRRNSCRRGRVSREFWASI